MCIDYYAPMQIDNLKDSLLCETGFTGLLRIPRANKNGGTVDCTGLSSSMTNGLVRELPHKLILTKHNRPTRGRHTYMRNKTNKNSSYTYVVVQHLP